MSRTLTTTERRRPTTLRAAVRRLFALASNPSSDNPSPVGMFDRAQNTNIQHATFTINQYGGIVADTIAAMGDGGSTSDSLCSHQVYDEPLPNLRRENPDVYVDCLLSEKNGYPLWIPSPSMTLPVLHRTLGVSLGDVGVLTPEGGFEFLFNIFQDVSHPVNTVVGVPEGFLPFMELLGLGIGEFVDRSAGSYISNPRMARVIDGPSQTNENTVLKSLDTEAAVLMMPEDMYAFTMHLTSPLYKYIRENITAWYKFVKHTLGRNINNGDLRVVYSCRKSSGFGIATTFNPNRQQRTQLTFSVDRSWTGISGCPYRWTHSGSAEFKTGPSHREISDLNLTQPCRNQCLFVRTIDTKVSATIWNGIEELAIDALVNESWNLTSSGSKRQTGSSRRPPGKLDARERGHTSISHRYQERVFHPSAILYDILESMAPDLAVYMVCDDDWAPFIKSKDMNVRDFVVQFLTEKLLVEHAGIAFFQDRRHMPQAGPDVTITSFHSTGSPHLIATRGPPEHPLTVQGKTGGKHIQNLSLPGQPSESIHNPQSSPSKPATREKMQPGQ